MRKLLLLTALAVTGLASYAQTVVHRDVNLQQSMLEEKSTGAQQSQSNSTAPHRRANSRSVSNHVKLNSQRIGSAGNLLTVDYGNDRQIDVCDTINSVVFIHRNDPSIFPGTNVAEYRYDASKDGGNTWISNIGPITNSSIIDNVYVNGRFPQGCIYNPVGNTVADSAFLVYSGTWHDSPGGTTGSWQGQMRGRGNLSGDTSTFNVHIDVVNNGMVDVASGFCQSTPGVFWNINQNYTGNFAGNTGFIVNGILVEKGVWDSTTRDVNWTVQNIPTTFDSVIDGTVYASIATSFSIAFDPTGQYGWIACLGAITAGDSAYEPIFWKSVDGGNTWSAPIDVKLASIPAVVAQLNPFSSNGSPTSLVPTTAYDENLVVDYLGNPHMVVIVGNLGGSYAITGGAGYTAWDITYNPNLPVCETGWNGWKPLFLDSVETLRGSFSTDNPPITQDNRPMAARSADGKKVFFYWVDSDISFVGSDDNSSPNLFTRAFDLEHFTSTDPIDLTIGDSLWGGETSTTPGGLFEGATFGTCSQIAHQVGSTYNVPIVLTQLDYNHDPSLGLGSYLNPCAFWYINNISYDPYDFVNGLAATVTLNGPDSVILLEGTPYTELGAQINYLDTNCYPAGPLHLVEDSSTLNVNADGTYYIHYLAEDANGNVYASANLTVVVGSAPVCNFSFSHSQYPYKVQFRDLSTNNPNSWFWTFGDGRSATTENPLHIYNVDSVGYMVCLTAYNSFGSCNTCQSVPVTEVGINNIGFSDNVSLYPNPSNGKVTLEIAENTLSELSVSVLDILGNEVVPATRYQAGTSKIEMNLVSLASGVYLVRVTCEQGTAIKYLNISNH